MLIEECLSFLKKCPMMKGVFIEPLACVVRGLKTAEMKPGQTVLVIGSGISGLLQIKLAKAWKAGKILATDVEEYRLKAAKKFGADVVIHAKENVPEQVKKHNDGKLADLVILCTGALSAVKQALQSVESWRYHSFLRTNRAWGRNTVPVV